MNQFHTKPVQFYISMARERHPDILRPSTWLFRNMFVRCGAGSVSGAVACNLWWSGCLSVCLSSVCFSAGWKVKGSLSALFCYCVFCLLFLFSGLISPLSYLFCSCLFVFFWHVWSLRLSVICLFIRLSLWCLLICLSGCSSYISPSIIADQHRVHTFAFISPKVKHDPVTGSVSFADTAFNKFLEKLP